MKKALVTLILSLTSTCAHAKKQVELVHVFKSERRLELVGTGNQVIKTYRVMLGKNPVGHKVQEGDNKTPEGTYALDLKNPKSQFYKSLHISYPNLKDKLKARALGLKPGGDIMLHGFPNNFKEMSVWLDSVGLGDLGDELIRASLPYFDWTSGCIAVTDAEMDEIYELIEIPTKIVISP